jgi:hypothetical protein
MSKIAMSDAERREHKRESNRRFRLKHPGCAAAYDLTHRDEHNARNAAWYVANPGYNAAWYVADYAANPEKYAAQHAAFLKTPAGRGSRGSHNARSPTATEPAFRQLQSGSVFWQKACR